MILENKVFQKLKLFKHNSNKKWAHILSQKNWMILDFESEIFAFFDKPSVISLDYLDFRPKLLFLGSRPKILQTKIAVTKI